MYICILICLLKSSFKFTNTISLPIQLDFHQMNHDSPHEQIIDSHGGLSQNCDP